MPNLAFRSFVTIVSRLLRGYERIGLRITHQLNRLNPTRGSLRIGFSDAPRYKVGLIHVTAYASQSSHHCCTCISRAVSVVHYLLRIAPIIGSPVKGGVNHPSIL